MTFRVHEEDIYPQHVHNAGDCHIWTVVLGLKTPREKHCRANSAVQRRPKRLSQRRRQTIVSESMRTALAQCF